jgi:hypothetical protein
MLRLLCLLAALAIAGCSVEASPPDAVPTPTTTPTVDPPPRDEPPAPAPSPLDHDSDGVEDTKDCAPEDSTRWRMAPYSFRDADGDGHTAPARGFLCIGDDYPPGYGLSPSGDDCDDGDRNVFAAVVAHADLDGDGQGAGPPVTQCTAGKPLPGFSTTSSDCAPDDKTRYQMLSYAHRDADGDGETVPESGTICAGASLPRGYALSASGSDCNDNDGAVKDLLPLYVDNDGDGRGAGALQQLCVAQRPSGYSNVGTDCDDADAAAYVTVTARERSSRSAPPAPCPRVTRAYRPTAPRAIRRASRCSATRMSIATATASPSPSRDPSARAPRYRIRTAPRDRVSTAMMRARR